jgi:hypothetical protein
MRTSVHPVEPPAALTLSEQLDAMLTGWLERRTDTRQAGRVDATAAAVITVAEPHVAEVERFCENWQLSVERIGNGAGRWIVLRVAGRALPVEGFAEITGMYRS